MSSKSRQRENVLKRAGDLAGSLLSEGYFLRWRYNHGLDCRVQFAMKHQTNGNLIEADITPTLTKIWKNHKLIKSESHVIRDV